MSIIKQKKIRETLKPIYIQDFLDLGANQLVLDELQRSDIIPAKALQLLTEDEQRAIPAIAKDFRLIREIESRIQMLPSSHSIILGDSRDMGFILDESIHLILTSPPYWNLKQYKAVKDNWVIFKTMRTSFLN